MAASQTPENGRASSGQNTLRRRTNYSRYGGQSTQPERARAFQPTNGGYRQQGFQDFSSHGKNLAYSGNAEDEDHICLPVNYASLNQSFVHNEYPYSHHSNAYDSFRGRNDGITYMSRDYDSAPFGKFTKRNEKMEGVATLGRPHITGYGVWGREADGIEYGGDPVYGDEYSASDSVSDSDFNFALLEKRSERLSSYGRMLASYYMPPRNDDKTSVSRRSSRTAPSTSTKEKTEDPGVLKTSYDIYSSGFDGVKPKRDISIYISVAQDINKPPQASSPLSRWV